MLQFQRASPDGPWRVELRARLINNTPPPAIVADRGGHAGTVDARRTKQLRFSGEQVVETLSAYTATARAPRSASRARKRWWPRGRLPPGLVKRRNQSNKSFQIQHRDQYRPGSHPTTAYRLGDGGGLVLVSLQGTRRMYTREPTLVTLQQDASREGFGGRCHPGSTPR